MAKRPYANDRHPQKPYDLIRELFIALGIMGALVLILAGVFSTPDVPALTAKQVAQQAPQILVQTALDDLAGQDAISTYGPPYSNTAGAAPHLGFLAPQQWGGVTLPIDSAQVEVIRPLETVLPLAPALKQPLGQWQQATSGQQATWVGNVDKAIGKATLHNGLLVLPGATVAGAYAPPYGPVPQLLNSYLAMARSGLLEPAIDGTIGAMPVTDRTQSLLLLQDAAAAQYASKLDMTGDQWGIIKETGNYPGAVWLWFYTLLYQIPPFSTSDAADLLVVLTIGVVTVVLMLTPFIPGLRSLPRILGLYRLIWRRWYRDKKVGGTNR